MRNHIWLGGADSPWSRSEAKLPAAAYEGKPVSLATVTGKRKSRPFCDWINLAVTSREGADPVQPPSCDDDGRVAVAVVRGKPGVYSTIWCLCYKTNELEKRRKKGARLSDKHWWHTGKGATSV